MHLRLKEKKLLKKYVTRRGVLEERGREVYDAKGETNKHQFNLFSQT
jgi:hypothetical protein